MACGCQKSSAILTSGQPQQLANNGSIEYVVRMPDGSYSEPQASMQAAFELAAQTGGQARAKAKVKA